MKFFALFMPALFLMGCRNQMSKNVKGNLQQQPETAQNQDTLPKPGEWLNHISELDTTDSCIRMVINLVHYLDTEKLSRINTFDHYKLRDTFKGAYAALDIKSNKTARAFRTNIAYQLKESGVNFAGKYAFVGVGMTGYGENHWIVDRTNGRAYTFPYLTDDLEFRLNSNLITVRPKASFFGYL